MNIEKKSYYQFGEMVNILILRKYLFAKSGKPYSMLICKRSHILLYFNLKQFISVGNK